MCGRELEATGYSLVVGVALVPAKGVLGVNVEDETTGSIPMLGDGCDREPTQLCFVTLERLAVCVQDLGILVSQGFGDTRAHGVETVGLVKYDRSRSLGKELEDVALDVLDKTHDDLKVSRAKRSRLVGWRLIVLPRL